MNYRTNNIPNLKVIKALRGEALIIDLGKEHVGTITAWMKRDVDDNTYRSFEIRESGRILYLSKDKASDFIVDGVVMYPVSGKWYFDVEQLIEGEDVRTIYQGTIFFQGDITGSNAIEVEPPSYILNTFAVKVTEIENESLSGALTNQKDINIEFVGKFTEIEAYLASLTFETSGITVSSTETESLSGTAANQSEVNAEFKVAIEANTNDIVSLNNETSALNDEIISINNDIQNINNSIESINTEIQAISESVENLNTANVALALSEAESLSGESVNQSEVNLEFVEGINNKLHLQPEYIDFEVTGAVPTNESYRFYPDMENKTFSFGVPDGGSIQVGQEIFDYYVNADDVPLVNGDIVSISQLPGNRTAVVRTDATDAESAKSIIGMVTVTSIAVNQVGRITKLGKVRELPTGAFAERARIFADPLNKGKWTDVQPQAPFYCVCIGIVDVSNNINGIIDVHPQVMPKLTDLSDVNGTPLTETGQIPVWDNENEVFDFTANIKDFLPQESIETAKALTGFIDGDNIEIYYNFADRTATFIGDLRYQWRGRIKTLDAGGSWTSGSHANIVGPWFLASIDGINFIWTQVPWEFTDIQCIYVNYTGLIETTFAVRETHKLMDPECHRSDHKNIGTYRDDGGILTAGTYTLNTSTDAAITPGFDAANVSDEDLHSFISQWLEGLYTTMYIGVSGVPVFSITDSFPFKFAVASFIQWNNSLTGSLITGANNKFYNVYQILIPTTKDAGSQRFRTVLLQPQRQFDTLLAAQNEDPKSLNLGNLLNLSPEFVLYAVMTFGTNSSYTTTGKVQLNDIRYLTGSRSSLTSISGFNPVSHPNLQSLDWNNSGHTGTPNKIAGFGENGEAIIKDAPVQLVTTIGTGGDYSTLSAAVTAGKKGKFLVLSNFTEVANVTLGANLYDIDLSGFTITLSTFSIISAENSYSLFSNGTLTATNSIFTNPTSNNCFYDFKNMVITAGSTMFLNGGHNINAEKTTFNFANIVLGMVTDGLFLASAIYNNCIFNGSGASCSCSLTGIGVAKVFNVSNCVTTGTFNKVAVYNALNFKLFSGTVSTIQVYNTSGVPGVMNNVVFTASILEMGNISVNSNYGSFVNCKFLSLTVDFTNYANVYFDNVEFLSTSKQTLSFSNLTAGSLLFNSDVDISGDANIISIMRIQTTVGAKLTLTAGADNNTISVLYTKAATVNSGTNNTILIEKIV